MDFSNWFNSKFEPRGFYIKNYNTICFNLFKDSIDIIGKDNYIYEYDYVSSELCIDDYNNYAFSVSGISLSRFKADIFGYAYIDDMTFAESSASADEIMEYLTGPKRYNIDTEGLSKKTIIKLVALRYAMGLAELPAEALASCDVDGSGETDVQDALAILRYAMGLLEEL